MRFSSSKYTNYNYKDNYNIYSRGFAPDPTGEDYSASPDPYLVFRGPFAVGERRERGEERRKGKERKGRAGQGRGCSLTSFL